MSTNYLGANVHGLASPADAVPEGALPPLPKCKMLVGHHLDSLHVLYSAEQVREIQREAYEAGRAAVEADRVQRPLPTIEDADLTWAIAGKLGEFYPQETPRDMEKNHRLARAIQRLPLLRHTVAAVVKAELATRCRAEGGDGAVMDYGSSVDNSADRAQQGEPVGERAAFCPACQGSGEGMAMEGSGPDAYEVPCTCPYCKGSGDQLDAYHGVVSLLDAEREKYLALCGKQFFAATKAAAPADARELPPLYAQALDLVHEAQRASVSLVQRRLRIGWSEARDLIQLMHDRSQIPDAWLPPGVYPRRRNTQSPRGE